MNEKEAIRKIKISLTRSVYTEFFGFKSLISGNKNVFFPLSTGKMVSQGCLCLVFRKKGRKGEEGRSE